MAAMVTYLCPRERVWLDSARIGTLYAQFGPAEVQALLDRAISELGLVHDELRGQFHRRDMDGFLRNLRRMRRIADHLGMSMLARVAGDVMLCLEIGDDTAVSATWARLSRSAFQAQSGAWESA
jgi:hypothetical protein